MSRAVLTFPGGERQSILLCDATPEQFDSYAGHRGVKGRWYEPGWFKEEDARRYYYGLARHEGAAYGVMFASEEDGISSLQINTRLGTQEDLEYFMRDFLAVTSSREVDSPVMLEHLAKLNIAAWPEKRAVLKYIGLADGD